MSIRFMDGFDQFANAVSATTSLIQAGYTATGALSFDLGRTGTTYACRIGSGVSGGTLGRTFNTAQQLVVLGFAYKAENARATIVQVASGFSLNWNTATGKLEINGNAGTATVVLGVFYYFEIVVDKVLSEIRVYVNNELDLTVGMPSGMATMTAYACSWVSTGDPKELDDLIFIDSATGSTISYANRIGPIEIQARLPSSDVDTDFATASGSDHFEMVNNVPPNETQYIQSNTSGAVDTFLSNAGITNPTGILAVGLVAYARKTDIDNRQMGLLIGTKSGPNRESPAIALDTAYAYKYAVFEKAVDNTAWDDIKVSDTPFGVVVRP